MVGAWQGCGLSAAQGPLASPRLGWPLGVSFPAAAWDSPGSCRTHSRPSDGPEKPERRPPITTQSSHLSRCLATVPRVQPAGHPRKGRCETCEWTCAVCVHPFRRLESMYM